ncbi:MAG: hypothetical protein PHV56_01790 [Clostridia bacterium]|nr:hypothetical protein [Clostridia bacterium]
MTGELEKYKKEAREIFSRTKYCQTQREKDKECLEQEVDKLAVNMITVHNKGLYNLNENLIKSGRKVWDFIAEHNFAIELLKADRNVPIEYEPNYKQKPPDFVVIKNGITFWLQMKKSAINERDNRQDKIFDSIAKRIENVKQAKLIELNISEQFTGADVVPLVSLIEEELVKNEDEKYFYYPNVGEPKAKFLFLSPNKIVLNHLKFGFIGDLDVIECTGEDSEQIRKGLLKASKAFDWDIDSKNLNLVVIEADNKKDDDIGEACFGTENIVAYPNGAISWSRMGDGFFNIPEYITKVAGVIIVRRDQSKPIPLSYSKTLFINEKYRDRIDEIEQVIYIDKVIGFSDIINEQ